MRSTRCHYCHGTIVDPIPRGALTVDGVAVEACFSCWAAHDDEDDRRTLESARLADAPANLRAAMDVPRRQRQVEDLTGQRFGRLAVVGQTLYVGSDGKQRLAWEVRCDCGRELVMRTSVLRRGAQSCHPCAAKTASKERAFCKLSPMRAEQVRIARARGWTLKQIATRFGVSQATACNVVNGKTWRSAA